MKRFYFIMMLVLGLGASAFAQPYPVVTIRQIQEVPIDSLGTTTTGDLSPLVNDTVTVRGVVVSQPGVAESTSTNGRWIWIQDGNGPWSGINVRGTGSQTSPDDMLNAVPGDSVEITGIVNEFNNETQITPFNSGGFAILTGVTGLRPVLIRSLQNLNDFGLNNPPVPSSPNGEPLEGTFVEITDLEVVSVTATATRCNFTVRDVNGNEVNIYDTYSVLRPSPSGSSGIIPYPNFNPPVVGDIFDTLRGIVDGRVLATPPYSLAPFDTTHIVYGPSAPKITNVFRNVQVPTDMQTVTITATIADNGGSIVGTPQLFYAFGETNTNFTPVGMTFTGVNNQYTAVIPAAADGQMVKYYLQATDNDAITTSVPSAGANDKKFFYFVRNTGKLTIRDVQYTIYSDGNSGYIGETVTVEGIVTASASPAAIGLGSVFIQDPTGIEWAGVQVVPDGGISNYASTLRGELVEVTGLVVESFGVTQIRVSDANGFSPISSLNVPAPIDVDPGDFTSYSQAFEKYEGMLVKLVPGAGQDSIFVVEDNADAPSDFGEYRVGRDKFDPSSGCRVLAGRSGGSNNVSYVTSRTDLIVNAPLPRIVVGVGDNMESLTGVMTYSFGNFKLMPRNNNDFESYQGGTVVIALDKNNTIGNEVNIYPNPTQNELNFINNNEANLDLAIYNMLGERVWASEAKGKSNTYSLRHLMSGQYILRVMDQGKFVDSFQLVIQR
jgi:DNA/RNA endonuclease YhcR with UshA esterase domain